MISEELKEHIKALIAKDQLEKALEELGKAGKNVTSFQNRLHRFEQEKREATYSQEYYERTNNKLVKDILSLLDAKEIPQKRQFWILVTIALIVVSGIIYLAMNAWGKGTDNDPRLNFLATGKVVDSTGNPIEGVSVKVNNYPNAQTMSKRNGTFFLSLEFEGEKYLDFEFSHEKYKPSTEAIRISSENDTFTISQEIVLHSAFIPQKETQTSKSTKSPKSFCILFRGEEWKDNQIKTKLEGMGYQYASCENASHKIEINFPANAISRNISGLYHYNSSLPPAILVDGKTCQNHGLKMGSPPSPEPESELIQFLQARLNAHFSSSALLDEIVKKL